MKDKIPSKRLVQESIEVLELLNSQEYRELQNKFNSLYFEIKKEQLMMVQIVRELKLYKQSFVKKSPISKKVLNLNEFNKATLKLTYTMNSYKLTTHKILSKSNLVNSIL